MKTYVEFVNTKTIVKEKEGIVIFEAYVQHRLPSLKGLYYYNIMEDGSCTTKRFVGVARCNKSDQFNEVIGKRIAESRCKQKIYKYYRNLYRKAIDKILTSTLRFKCSADKLDECYLTEMTHELELIRNT